MTSTDPDIALLNRWHDAVNRGDIDAAVAECAQDVAITGPRGTGHGHDLVRTWLERSGIRLQPQEEFVEKDGRFVVLEMARWTTAAAPDGAPIDPTETWVVFTVTGGKLSSIERYESASDVPSA